MILKKEYSNVVRYWLYSQLFLLIFIVAVGGLTRLTNSGLSITEWEVISGIFPPFNNKDWHEAFALYKKIPQYYLVNKKYYSDKKRIYLKLPILVHFDQMKIDYENAASRFIG